jgi:hypothetical protein
MPKSSDVGTRSVLHVTTMRGFLIITLSSSNSRLRRLSPMTGADAGSDAECRAQARNNCHFSCVTLTRTGSAENYDKLWKMGLREGLS